MYEFIRIVTGEIPEPEWWEKVYNEYTELSGSIGENKQLELAKTIEYIQTKIKIVQSLVSRLWVRRIDGVIEILQYMGFPFDFTDLRPDLERVILMLKGEQIELNRAIVDYEELIQNGEHGEKQTSLNWYSILAMLGKHNSISLNAQTLTVIQYIAYDLQFRQWVEMNRPKSE